MAYTIEEKEKQTIKMFGTEIPRWKDCSWCGAKLACEFDRVAYRDPCEDCRLTDKWKQKEAESEKYRGRTMSDMLKSQEVAAVWNVKGRNVYTNYKGDVISDEPYRPIKAGQKDWRHK